MSSVRADPTVRVLRALLSHGSMQKVSLSTVAGINRQVLNKTLADMTGLGLVLVEERGPREHVVHIGRAFDPRGAFS